MSDYRKGNYKRSLLPDNTDVALTKMVDDKMLGQPMTWMMLLNQSKKVASFDMSYTYDRVYDIIERFERKREESLPMWPGCDKCKRLYPIVIAHPTDSGVLTAPHIANRTCVHHVNHDQPLHFHIKWDTIVLLKDEIIARWDSRVDDVKLVRRPGTKRIR